MELYQKLKQKKKCATYVHLTKTPSHVVSQVEYVKKVLLSHTESEGHHFSSHTSTQQASGGLCNVSTLIQMNSK